MILCTMSTVLSQRQRSYGQASTKMYKTEDASIKKFIMGRFLKYKMVDSKTVISQVQEFQLVLHEIEAEGMILSEIFQVATILEKLPPGGEISITI